MYCLFVILATILDDVEFSLGSLPCLSRGAVTDCFSVFYASSHAESRQRPGESGWPVSEVADDARLCAARPPLQRHRYGDFQQCVLLVRRVQGHWDPLSQAPCGVTEVMHMMQLAPGRSTPSMSSETTCLAGHTFYYK